MTKPAAGKKKRRQVYDPAFNPDEASAAVKDDSGGRTAPPRQVMKMLLTTLGGSNHSRSQRIPRSNSNSTFTESAEIEDIIGEEEIHEVVPVLAPVTVEPRNTVVPPQEDVTASSVDGSYAGEKEEEKEEEEDMDGAAVVIVDEPCVPLVDENCFLDSASTDADSLMAQRDAALQKAARLSVDLAAARARSDDLQSELQELQYLKSANSVHPPPPPHQSGLRFWNRGPTAHELSESSAAKKNTRAPPRKQHSDHSDSSTDAVDLWLANQNDSSKYLDEFEGEDSNHNTFKFMSRKIKQLEQENHQLRSQYSEATLQQKNAEIERLTALNKQLMEELQKVQPPPAASTITTIQTVRESKTKHKNDAKETVQGHSDDKALDSDDYDDDDDDCVSSLEPSPRPLPTTSMGFADDERLSRRWSTIA
jgi:hypothetical protein